MADKSSPKRAGVTQELAIRVAAGLGVRALWAVIIELFRHDL